MATLSAWPPILPNQAPGKDGSDRIAWGGNWGRVSWELVPRGTVKRKEDWTRGSKQDGNWERWNSRWQFWKPGFHACLTSCHTEASIMQLTFSTLRSSSSEWWVLPSLNTPTLLNTVTTAVLNQIPRYGSWRCRLLTETLGKCLTYLCWSFFIQTTRIVIPHRAVTD